MNSSHLRSVCLVLVAAGSLAADEFFEAQVRPLLVQHCYECHQRRAEGGLRLDSRQAMLRGGNSGRAIVPGNAAKSLLVRAVRREHEELAMPPDTPLTPSEVAILTKWIEQGAHWPDDLPTQRSSPDAFGITASERAFWSFQPIRRRAPPAVHGPWGEHPIDAFIAKQHHGQGLNIATRCSPRELLRRLSYDLIGLPPTPQELVEFERRTSRDWQSAIHNEIERLLDSPHYGERWAQHWLDLVRYADTAGDAADFPIPEAYKYRNYVIEAFNQDKPYDQFVREQIAGDLMPSDDERESWQRTVATGYIALSRRVGVSPQNQPHIIIEDTLNNLGKTFLGLTIGCARCHDHKFDPIPTSDYYALYGIFQSSVFPHAGAEHQPYRSDFVYRIGNERAMEALSPYQKTLDQLRRRERAAFERYRDLQRKAESELGYTREESWREVLELREAIRQFAETIPKLETAFAISEGTPADAAIQEQGDPRKEANSVRRGFLHILGGQTLPEGTTQSGRLELANWIASPENPLTARVIANRVWHYHFGRGLVASTSHFGVRGEKPSHPELLDFLAGYLIDNGWSIKSLHRLILTSRTWQLSSNDIASSSAIDPDNVYLWRGNRRRLDAEQLRDTILMIGDQLDTSRGQAHPFPHQLTYFFRQHEPFLGSFSSKRRSVYLFRQRIRKNRYLDLFDGSDGNLHVGTRRPTTTSLQSLYLLNSEFVEEQAQAVAARVMSVSTSRDARIRWAYAHLFARQPTTDELATVTRRVDQIQDKAENGQAGAEENTNLAAWTTIIHAMMCSNEFLFVD